MRMPPGQRLPRGTYLGGHDAARIVGVFPYGAGAADTYAHVVHGVTLPDNPIFLRGRLMEPGLIGWLEEQRGCKITRDLFLLDDEVPFFAGTVDGIEDNGEVMHEVTTTTSWNKHLWGIPGTEDCASYKWVQSQWYMGLDDKLREAHVTCFIVDGDEEPLRYIVPRNEVAIRELRAQCEEFWFEHILARVPPLAGVHNHVDEANALQACFPNAVGDVLNADAEMVAAAERYASYRDIEKAAAKNKEIEGTRIKSMLTKHKGARWAGGSVSWQERSIGTKTNWEAVAHELAQLAKVDGHVFQGLVRENTFEAKSVRALRVSVKGVK